MIQASARSLAGLLVQGLALRSAVPPPAGMEPQ
jgi:hypothetical protein